MEVTKSLQTGLSQIFPPKLAIKSHEKWGLGFESVNNSKWMAFEFYHVNKQENEPVWQDSETIFWKQQKNNKVLTKHRLKHGEKL